VFRTIFVALDGSEFSEKALPAAIDIAKSFGGGLVLLRSVGQLEVWPADIYTFDVSAYDRVQELDRLNVLKYLDNKVAELKAQGLTNVSSLEPIPTRNPADWICEEAERANADMIVMSTHGRSGMGRVIHGSVAERVSRHAPCPVLLVPARDPVST
jgi:nucleotide-binding universal stress UspA family protein